MTVQIAWYQEPKVALMRLNGVISAANLRASVEMLYDWTEASNVKQMHLIIDAQKLVQLPSILELSKLKVHQRRGSIVAFGVQDTTLRFVSSIAIQILKMELRFVDTLEEAIEFLRKIDVELEDLALMEPSAYVEFNTERIR